MNKKQKFNAVTLIVFVIAMSLGLLTGNGYIEKGNDYMSPSLMIGSIIWLILRLYGFLRFKK